MAAVFISYRTPDRALVERLVDELRAAGHRVWFDVENIRIGDSIVGGMNAGLERAEYVVVCFSAHGCAPWMDREWMSALARQLDGQGVKLLPVKLSGGDLPAILGDLRSADLAANWAAGVRDLLAAIG